MSRFNSNNRGGMGMNNYQPRRGAGGPMRGGLMGNPNLRNHPIQNHNQNRRGGNSNFNRSLNQGPSQTPPKQQTHSTPIIPPPSPGPALTMEGPMQQQKAAEQEREQNKPATLVPQSPIQSPPPKPTITSPQPGQENKNQEQQVKSPAGNANGQQQKQPPLPSPKTAPQQGQRLGPQQGQRFAPQQGQRFGPQPGQRMGPQHGQRAGPQHGQRTLPLLEKQQDEPMAMDQAAESDGSQPKVCRILGNLWVLDGFSFC